MQFVPLSGIIYPFSHSSSYLPSQTTPEAVTDVSLSLSAKAQTYKDLSPAPLNNPTQPQKPQRKQEQIATMKLNRTLPSTLSSHSDESLHKESQSLSSPQKTLPHGQPQKHSDNLTAAVSQIPNAPEQVIKKAPEQILFSQHILNNVVKNSNNSYYFSGKSLTLRDVTLEILSLTPYQDKDILKFTIQNNQQDYFFISNVFLYEQQTPISARFFYEPLLGPGKSMDCSALISRRAQSQLSLVIIESSGKNRTFTLKFVSM